MQSCLSRFGAFALFVFGVALVYAGLVTGYYPAMSVFFIVIGAVVILASLICVVKLSKRKRDSMDDGDDDVEC